MTRPSSAVHLGRATLRNSVWYGDQLITFLAIGDDTAGQFALLHVHGGPGGALPPHVHTQEDATLYLLAGELTVTAGGAEWQAGPGDAVTIPRGLAHSVRHASAEVTYLLQFSPAGFERYFHELGAPAQYLGRPPQPAPLDRAQLVATAARYGCVVRGRDP